MKKIAILITTYNRADKTMQCLSTLYISMKEISDYLFDVYIVDDNSTDGTFEMIQQNYPDIFLMKGTGSLYWAGGMRLAWQKAIDSNYNYEGFLLLNDDVELFPTFWKNIEDTIEYSFLQYGTSCICTLSTKDKSTGEISYGGSNLEESFFKHKAYKIVPTNEVQECMLTNGNILYVSKETVNKIGTLDENYRHSLADFDYSLSARKQKIPVLVCPNYGGYCSNDHLDDILDKNLPFRQRVANLYSIKGIALNKYMYYLCKHFYFKAPYLFVVIWLRTLFPGLVRK